MVTVGISDQDLVLNPDPEARRRLLDRVADGGIGHLTVGDHLSFHGGTGFDGIVSATSVLAAHERLSVTIGVYLLALRHPLAVARQISTLCQLAPGRLTLGVGVGGEDRSEVSNAGVDPATRGRRLDEALTVLSALSEGDAVTHHGEFFDLDDARVLPPPQPRVPIMVGGRGEPAVRRTARYGDGWLGIFCSARRFAATRQQILATAAELGRPTPSRFGVNVWCGLDADPARARDLLGQRMQALYRLPPEKFQHIAPAGTPAQVADWLAAFVEAGAQHVTVVPVADSTEAGIDAVAEIRERLTTPAG
jgi:alkanesulfonate monooxygenase SsuD/methylene tetrahydromethanopterin reductase-like flavin-dependent oxidoreductase (luciferase family)